MAEKEEVKEVQNEQPAEKSSSSKSKKISRMVLAEVEQKIKSAQEKMGGLRSAFSRHLLARKKELAEFASRKK